VSSLIASPSSVWPRGVSVTIDRERLRVELKDGREVSVPLGWFPWLAGATDEDRQDFELIEGGRGIWWERLDEGLSVPGLLGLPESPPRQKQDRYVIEYRREGKRWVAELPALDSSTWGATLAAAKREGRAALAMLLDVEDLETAGIEVVDEVHSTAVAAG
jgi:Protein of unknown function (DUF2442)